MVILTLKTFSIVFQQKCFINPLHFSNPLAKYVLQDRVLLRWPNSPQPQIKVDGSSRLYWNQLKILI